MAQELLCITLDSVKHKLKTIDWKGHCTTGDAGEIVGPGTLQA